MALTDKIAPVNTKILISPAYCVSVALLILATILVGTDLLLLGWITFIAGLGLNAMALLVIANRDYLRTGKSGTEQEGKPGD